MLDIGLAVAALLLLLAGFIGSALPVIPGPPLAWGGYLILNWTKYTEGDEAYATSLWIFLFFTVLVTVLDYFVPIWGTKKWGGSKAGMWGATIGLVIGMFVGPIGIIIGPFAGAFIGELATGKQQKEALRSGWGSFLGFLFGVGMKMMVCAVMLFFFFLHVFFR